MNKPNLQTSFEYDRQTILVDWFDVLDKNKIPDLAWSQVYCVGNLNGLVPLVTSTTGSKHFNLPGGTVETGESIEQTLKRELIEECNMRVISWRPLGYQICTESDGNQSAQFRVYAVLEKIGEFTHDPGGDVKSNTLISFKELEAMLQYGETGKRLMLLAKQYFK